MNDDLLTVLPEIKSSELIEQSSVGSKSYSILFIIALKYYRNYDTFIKYYVDNIQKFYPNSFTLIVDNNSKYIDDIHNMFNGYDRMKIITNTSIKKMDIGAYLFGIDYLIENNLIDTYDFIVFSQDTYVLKNKYDFNIFIENNIKAATVHSWPIGPGSLRKELIEDLHLTHVVDKITICWCNTFILHKSKILEFKEMMRPIVIFNKDESGQAELYLSGMLYILNNNNFALDFTPQSYVRQVQNPETYSTNVYFLKIIQSKDQYTQDI